MPASGASLSEWLARLESVNSKEIVLGLERVTAVLERLPPGRPASVLHVAGTNGKGSSVAMLAAILRAGGRSVGTYTSPHLRRYNERIVIDGEPASDAEIVAAFEGIEAIRGDLPLTYFEFGTLAAWLVFVARGVDVAVLEVGLGGRLDAVNAIEPDGGLITSIGLDHQDWLGDTLEAIAREKAGIMRPGKPTVFAAAERPATIDKTAEETGALLLAAGRDFEIAGHDGHWTWTGQNHALSGLDRPALAGEFQLANAAGVLTLLEAVGFDDALESGLINKALGAVTVPGRMQPYIDSNRWLFDVAHNPAAAEALAGYLRGNQAARWTAISGMTAAGDIEHEDQPLESVPGEGLRTKRVAVLGMLETKDVEGVVLPLADVVDEWIAVTADSPRALPAAELGRRVANALDRHCLVVDDPGGVIDEARRLAGEDGEILVLGSFNIVGPVQELLGL